MCFKLVQCRKSRDKCFENSTCRRRRHEAAVLRIPVDGYVQFPGYPYIATVRELIPAERGSAVSDDLV